MDLYRWTRCGRLGGAFDEVLEHVRDLEGDRIIGEGKRLGAEAVLDVAEGAEVGAQVGEPDVFALDLVR